MISHQVHVQPELKVRGPYVIWSDFCISSINVRFFSVSHCQIEKVVRPRAKNTSYVRRFLNLNPISKVIIKDKWWKPSYWKLWMWRGIVGSTNGCYARDLGLNLAWPRIFWKLHLSLFILTSDYDWVHVKIFVRCQIFCCNCPISDSQL